MRVLSANRAEIDPHRAQCPMHNAMPHQTAQVSTRVSINDQMARTRAKSIANVNIQVRQQAMCNTNDPSRMKPRRSNRRHRRPLRLNRKINKARQPNVARVRRPIRLTKTTTNRLIRRNNSTRRLANIARRPTRTTTIDAMLPRHQASPINVELQPKSICK